VFGLQTLLDPMTLIILGVLVLCLVLWAIFAARRRPALRATVQDDAPPPIAPAPRNPGPIAMPPGSGIDPFTDQTVNMYTPPPPAPAPSSPMAPTGVPLGAVYNAETGTMTGPFPLPPAEMPLQDSRIVAPTEVVVLWRAVSRDVEEYSVRIDTVSHDQLVFGGLVHNARAPQAGALERRLFHTMVLPDESMLSIRTRAGTPIKNVRAWLRSLPDAGEPHLT